MKLPSSCPLCEERFTETETGKKIIVRLWAPVFNSEKDAYCCMTEATGVVEDGLIAVYGCSAFQAVSISFLRFRKLFEKESGNFLSISGNPPHVYFPQEIPWVYGSDVYEKLCKMVGDDVQKIEDERTKRRESRNRDRGP